MAKETVFMSENAKMSPADLHKDSGVAISEAKWYIAECKPTRERTIRAALEKMNIEAYVASQLETHVYKSRNKRKVEKVVIPGKVFVRTQENMLMRILLDFSSIYRFMLNRAATNENGFRPYAVVPENQMAQLQYMLGNASNPVYLTADDLKVDQRVKVMRGPLAGFEANFMKRGHESYIVLKVEMGMSHYAITEMPIEDVQPVN